MRYVFFVLFSFLLSACSDRHSTDFLGYIEGRYIYLSSSMAGHLVQLSVHKGESVQTGQIAFALDSRPESSALAIAKSKLRTAQFDLANFKSGQRETILKTLEARVAQAESSLQFSTDTLKRNEALRQKVVIGQATLDEFRTKYQRDLQTSQEMRQNLAKAKLGAREYLIAAQEAKMKAAAENVKRAEWALAQKTVAVPKAGVIEEIFVRKNEFVPAGKPVVSLLPPENRILVFFVPEKALSQIKIGEEVYFKCDVCQRLESATINYIASQAQHTPPVIYSKDSRQKLVYWIEARIHSHAVLNTHPGQIVDVMTRASHANKI